MKKYKTKPVRMKQMELLPKPSLECGGSFNNTRHVRRTLCFKKPTHLTLKSKKSVSLFKKRDEVTNVLKKQAKSFGIKVFTFSIQRDHIHVSLQIPDREAYKKFIRALTGVLARMFGKGLWKTRPYTRILSGFNREFWNLNDYIFRNECEVFRIWQYDRSQSVRQLAEKSWTGLFQI